ncbi:hypothetical protein NMK71_01005 [Weeksellaceae bacterium KMM 9713]|uniref:Uncharacterized protein n=1 Tax=Profundicola chukchiensis TaxID=2961959 RepID=A0A9X4MZ29_9FLAO|nr:hypothetical protein [Profundicola chukchiensis]MDG4944981.1 hypothetical protein [Profundicola chukchiensis]
MKEDQRYFNFPIVLLAGYLDDHRKVLDDIVDYCLYEQSLGLEDEDEDDLEKFSIVADYNYIQIGDPEKSFSNGKGLYESIPYNTAKVGLSLRIFWDFYKNQKPEFENVCLLAFLAIKSILHNKPYCKVTNKFWLSRMDGKSKSVKELTDLSSRMQKYSTEYQTKKIKYELIESWGLIHYSRYTRGFYVSYKLSLEDLIFHAEKQRKKYREKQQRKLIEEARLKALEKLKNLK